MLFLYCCYFHLNVHSTDAMAEITQASEKSPVEEFRVNKTPGLTIVNASPQYESIKAGVHRYLPEEIWYDACASAVCVFICLRAYVYACIVLTCLCLCVRRICNLWSSLLMSIFLISTQEKHHGIFPSYSRWRACCHHDQRISVRSHLLVCGCERVSASALVPVACAGARACMRAYASVSACVSVCFFACDCVCILFVCVCA